MQIMLRYTENIINAQIVGWIGPIGDWPGVGLYKTEVLHFIMTLILQGSMTRVKEKASSKDDFYIWQD